MVRGPARGKQWIASSSTHGFWLGYWELANQRRFAAQLRPGDVVYDVGAHVGLYTLLSSGAVRADGHVYAFEPFARNLEYLRRHIALNHLSNCTVVDAAISDTTTEQYFEPTEHDSAGHLSSVGSVRVRTVSLDDFVFGSEGHRPPTVMKINAEGAEMDVFRGAGTRLPSSCRRFFFRPTPTRSIVNALNSWNLWVTPWSVWRRIKSGRSGLPPLAARTDKRSVKLQMFRDHALFGEDLPRSFLGFLA